MEKAKSINAANFIEDFVNRIIGEKFSEFIQNPLNSDHLYYYHSKKPFTYVDLFLQLQSFFANSKMGQEPFLIDTDLNAFCKNLLKTFDITSDRVIEMAQLEIQEEIDTKDSKIEKLKASFNLDTPMSNLEFSEEQLMQRFENAKKLQKAIEPFHAEKDRLYAEALIKAKNNFTATLAWCLDNFLTRYEACESPLESAFLIGLIAHGDLLAQVTIMSNEVKNQVQIGNYRVDFLILNEEKKIKTIIELDGHTYHEKTEEQAVRDKTRDREMVALGYKMLRFHRKEIEDNLKRCVLEVERSYSGRNEIDFE